MKFSIEIDAPTMSLLLNKGATAMLHMALLLLVQLLLVLLIWQPL